MTLSIIDSGVANLGSVQAALRRIGVPARVVTDADSIRRADALLLPGVGAFAGAMAVLSSAAWWTRSGRPRQTAFR